MQISLMSSQFIDEAYFCLLTHSVDKPLHTLSGTKSLVQRLVKLCGVSKELHERISKINFFVFFSRVIHPFFVERSTNSENHWTAVLKEKYLAIEKWFSDPLKIHCQVFQSLERAHGYIEDTKLVVSGVEKFQKSKMRLIKQSLSENLKYAARSEIELTRVLTAPARICRESAVHGEGFTALLNDYNVVYLYSWGTKTLAKGILVEEGVVQQLQIFANTLYIRVSLSLEEIQRVYMYDLCNLETPPRCAQVPFTVKHIECSRTCMFLLVDEKTHSRIIVVNPDLSQSESESRINFPLIPSEALCVPGELNSVLAVTLKESWIAIQKMRLFEDSLKSEFYSFKVPLSLINRVSGSLRHAYFHLEKLFVVLSDGACMICDLHSYSLDKRCVTHDYYQAQVLDLLSEELPEFGANIHRDLAQIFGNSDKIYLLFNERIRGEQRSKICVLGTA